MILLEVHNHPRLTDPDYTTEMISWFGGGLHFFERPPFPTPDDYQLILDAYYFSYFIAFLIGYWLCLFWQKQGSFKAKRYQVHDLALYIIVGILLGAKLGYVLFYNLEYYLEHPSQIIFNWSGMASHGALIGCLIAMWIFAKRAKIKFLHVTDTIFCTAWLGGIFIRAANFLNGELYGRSAPDWLPFAMRFPMRDGRGNVLRVSEDGTVYKEIHYNLETLELLDQAYLVKTEIPRHAYESAQLVKQTFDPSLVYARLPLDSPESSQFVTVWRMVTDPSHPSQIYQLLIGGVLLGVVMLASRAKVKLVGTLTGIFFIAYGIGRFLTEFARQPDAQRDSGLYEFLSVGQLLSLGLVVVGVGVLMYRKKYEVILSEMPMPAGPAVVSKVEDEDSSEDDSIRVADSIEDSDQPDEASPDTKEDPQ